MPLIPAEQLDPKDYAGRDWPGYCAVCGKRKLVTICSKCHAAICAECKPLGMERVWAAIKAKVGYGSHGSIWLSEN